MHDTSPQLAIADYTLHERIGAGSYGEVWRARSVTGAERALKVVHRRSFQHDRPYRREFEGIQKFESLARGHPHLVTVFHVGRLEADEAFYYVMELADAVPGTTTDRYAPRTLRSDLDAGAPLTATALVQLGVALAEALGHLHRHGLIHRDVKPSNIIFVGGTPKLADIGLVAEAGENRSFVGTEGFVPPEGPGTPQGDLFSVGKVLYEAMTGRDRTEFPELPANFGARPDHGALLELNEIILRACERDPTRRHATAEDLLGELRLLQGGLSLRRLRQTERRLRFFRRVGIGAAVLALLAFVAVGLARREAARQRANFNAAETLRLRAEAAEKSAREQVHETSVALSRASRLSLAAGRRERALAAIRAGASVRPSRELADELIGVLAGEDLRADGMLTNLPAAGVAVFNPDLTAVAQPLVGAVLLSGLPDLRELRRLTCAEPTAPALVWSTEGRWLAAQHASGRLRVWEVDSARVALDMEAVGAWPSFSTNDLVALPFPDRRRVEVRSLRDGQSRHAWSVAFDFDRTQLSPDGSLLALNPLITPRFFVVAAASGEMRHDFALDAYPLELAWSANGRWLAAGADDQAVYLWSLLPGGPQQRLTGHQNAVHSVRFTDDSQRLLSSSWDGTTRLWEVSPGREVLRLGASGELGFGGRTARLAIQNYRHDAVQFHTLAPPTVVQTLMLPATNRSISPLGVAFSPDGRQLAVAAWDGAHGLAADSGQHLWMVPFPKLRTVSYLPEGNLLLAGDAGVARVTWANSATGAGHRLESLAPPHFHNFAANANDRVAGARGDHVWLDQPDRGRQIFTRSGWELQQVALSPDGRWLAAGGRRMPGFAVWDLATGQPASWAPPGDGPGAETAFSPDSRLLVAGDERRYAAYATTDGHVVWEVPRQDTAMLHGLIAFTAEGSRFACAVSRTTVSLHATATGERLATLEHPDPQQVTALTFSPDGRQLAVAGPTHQVRLWDLAAIARELKTAGLPWAFAKED